MTGFSRILSLFKSFPAITGLTIALIIALLKISALSDEIAGLNQRISDLRAVEPAASLCSESVTQIQKNCSKEIETALKGLQPITPDERPARDAEEFNAWMRGL